MIISKTMSTKAHIKQIAAIKVKLTLETIQAFHLIYG